MVADGLPHPYPDHPRRDEIIRPGNDVAWNEPTRVWDRPPIIYPPTHYTPIPDCARSVTL